MNFDDMPIGKSSAPQMSEFPDENWKPKVGMKSSAIASKKITSSKKSEESSSSIPAKAIASKALESSESQSVIVGEESDSISLPAVPPGAYNLDDLDAAAPTSEDAFVDERPLIEKIGDKNWKSRLSAYDDLRKIIDSGDKNTNIFTEYSTWISKMCADSNASALDGGLDTALLFIEHAPIEIVRQVTEKVASTVIDKTFGARMSTQLKGKAVLMKLMEADEPTSCTQQLISKLGDKKTKIPPACLEVIKEGMQLFGGKNFPIKEVISALGPVLNGTNGPAREMALSLILEMTRWIGKAPFNTLMDSVRSAQKTEFERLLAERDATNSSSGGGNPPVPSLWLRKERPAPGTEADVVNAIKAAKAAADDSREFIEEIDLMKKLRGTDYATLIAEEKWSEQFKALQIIIDILGPTPKLKSGCDVHDIMSSIKGFLRQGHVQLQVGSLKIIVLLADGMRNEFSSSVRGVTQAVVLKSKEKRLIPEVQVALLKILKYCLPFDSLLEDCNELVKNKKTPVHGRVGIMEFYITALSDMSERISSDCMKPIAEAFISCCEDSDPKVRETCMIGLAKLAPVVKARGKTVIEAHCLLMGLETAMPKVFKKMMSPPSETATAITAASTSSMGSSPGKKNAIDESSSKVSAASAVSRKPAASSTTSLKKTVSGSSSASITNVAKKTSTASAADKDDDNVEELAMTPEDAQNILTELGVEGWESTIQESMSSVKWQDKIEALSAIGQKIAETQTGGKFSAPLVMYLSSKLSKFKISNVNILKSVIQTTCIAAKNTGDVKFNKAAAWELMKNLADSDKKTKEPVDELLTALSESVSPAFVVKRMKVVMEKSKAPLAHQHYLEWLKVAIKDFGASSFPIPFLGQFCQLELENKNAAVRTAAVEVMGALYNQLGPRLQAVAMSDEMKPALKQLLEAEFTKIGYDPTASSKASRGAKGDDGEAGGAGGGIPRQDICSALDKNILSEMNLVEGKTSWQNRKVALEAVISACEKSGHFIEANKGTAELVKAVKVRMCDTQANNKPIAAAAIGHIIASLEPDVGAKYLRVIAGGLLGGLADNKKSMRDATTSALQMAVTLNRDGGDAASADAGLLAVLITPIGEALTATPIGRQELLTWLLLHTESLKIDCSELSTPLVLCMQDKTAEVRSKAELLMTILLSKTVISRAALDKSTRDLPPATLRTLQSSIDKMMAAYGTKKSTVTSASAEEKLMTGALNSSAAINIAPSSGSTTALVPASAPTIKPPAASAGVGKSVTTGIPKGGTKIISAPAASLVEANPPSSPTSDKWALKKTTKGRRLEEAFKTNWPQPPEEVTQSELVVLKSVWENLISPDLAAMLFPNNKFGPTNQDACLSTMNEISVQLEGPHASNHTDFILRWCCYVICLRESAAGLLRALELVVEVFTLMQKEGLTMHDAEANFIIPHLVDKCGHKSERHKVAFKQAITAAGEVLAPNKINQMLLQGLGSKNKRSRVVCLEEILRVVETAGAASLGRAGVREIAVYLDNKDNDVSGRNACLELCFALYTSLGNDQIKLMKLLGDMTERSTSMVEDRIKQKMKSSTSNNFVKPQSTNANQNSVPLTSTSTSSSSSSHGVVTGITSSVIPSTNHDSKTPPHSEKADLINNDVDSNDCGGMLNPFHFEMTPAPATRLGSSSPPPSPIPMTAFAKSPLPDGDMENGTWKDAASPAPVSSSSSSSNYASPNPMSILSSPNPASLTPGAVSRLTNTLAGIYSDIASKIDNLLVCEEEVIESDVRHEECKDYVKMLHAILMGEWSSEGEEAVDTDDESLLLANIEPLVMRLCKCVGRSFQFQSSNPCTPVEGSPSVGIDVSLVAVSLATLFATVKRSDVVKTLSEDCLLEIFKECSHRIVDKRLHEVATTSGESSIATDTSGQIARALNMVLLKLAAESKSSDCINALLRALMMCVSSREGDAAVSVLPIDCARPLSKLLLRVLTEEVKQSNPFKNDLFDLNHLLMTLHTCLSSLSPPLSSGSSNNALDEVPLRSIKTVLSEVVKAFGGATTLSLLLAAGISRDEPIVKMACRMGGITVGGEEAKQQEIVLSLIDEITSARDKVEPIRKLWQLKKQYPSLDLNIYLQKISSAFRRFVLDTLSKLDQEGDALGNENKIPPESEVKSRDRDRDNRNNTSKDDALTEKFTKERTIVDNSYVEGGGEAMKILDGLRRKSITPLKPVTETQLDSSSLSSSPSAASASLSMPPPPAAAAPSSPRARAALNDKIRGSLAGLTASLSLDLLPPTVPITSASSSYASGDSDLAQRLAALKARK